ncbi:hypothetical protein STENM223S_11217 [Streptomyces tendae]
MEVSSVMPCAASREQRRSYLTPSLKLKRNVAAEGLTAHEIETTNAEVSASERSDRAPPVVTGIPAGNVRAVQSCSQISTSEPAEDPPEPLDRTGAAALRRGAGFPKSYSRVLRELGPGPGGPSDHFCTDTIRRNAAAASMLSPPWSSRGRRGACMMRSAAAGRGTCRGRPSPVSPSKTASGAPPESPATTGRPMSRRPPQVDDAEAFDDPGRRAGSGRASRRRRRRRSGRAARGPGGDGAGEADGGGDCLVSSAAHGGRRVLLVAAAARLISRTGRSGSAARIAGIARISAACRLARHQPRRRTRPPRPDDPARPSSTPPAPPEPGRKGCCIDTGRQLHHPGRGTSGVSAPGDPGAGVLAEVRDRSSVDSPTRRSSCRAAPASWAQPASRPWVVATRRSAPARRRAGAIRLEGRGCHRRTPTCSRARAASRTAVRVAPGVGSSIVCSRSRTTVKGWLGVEGGGGLDALPGALPGGGVDDDALGVQAQRHVVQEGLDAAGTGREVVGDDQGLVHCRRPYRTVVARSATALLAGTCGGFRDIMAPA